MTCTRIWLPLAFRRYGAVAFIAIKRRGLIQSNGMPPSKSDIRNTHCMNILWGLSEEKIFGYWKSGAQLRCSNLQILSPTSGNRTLSGTSKPVRVCRVLFELPSQTPDQP